MVNFDIEKMVSVTKNQKRIKMPTEVVNNTNFTKGQSVTPNRYPQEGLFVEYKIGKGNKISSSATLNIKQFDLGWMHVNPGERVVMALDRNGETFTLYNREYFAKIFGRKVGDKNTVREKIINLLEQKGGMLQKDIHEEINVSQTAVTKEVNKMEKEGVVRSDKKTSQPYNPKFVRLK